MPAATALPSSPTTVAKTAFVLVGQPYVQTPATGSTKVHSRSWAASTESDHLPQLVSEATPTSVALNVTAARVVQSRSVPILPASLTCPSSIDQSLRPRMFSSETSHFPSGDNLNWDGTNSFVTCDGSVKAGTTSTLDP